jgi:uncharacterized protein (TIGR03437 family)
VSNYSSALVNTRNCVSNKRSFRPAFGLLLFPIVVSVASAQMPVITPGGTVNAASFGAGQPVAPGSLVAIFGTQLAGQLAAADTVPLSTTLGADSVSVTFNGIAAPLDFVSGGQINAQVPWDVLAPGINGTANVVVTRNGVASVADPVVVNQFAPGVFAASGHAIAIIATDPSDPRYASLAAPPGSIPGLTTFAARPGDILIVYATGLGPVSPAVLSGHDSLDQLRSTTPDRAAALIGNVPATVLFSGLTPQFPGVYQVNVQVPATAPLGNAIPIQVQIGGVISAATASIAIGSQ